MKKIKSLIALALLMIAFATCTENDPDVATPDEEEGIPEATPVGIPVDDMVTKEIGPDGGSISAIDSNLNLLVPAGALNSPASISVQPITNFAPGGVGNAYELSPDGQSFSKPVTITFNYSDSVQGGATWSEIGIAFQDADGFWHRAENIVSDSINKTISATSLHFTAFSIFRQATLTPIHSLVHVNKSVDLFLTVVASREDDDLMYLVDRKSLSTIWMVEGVENGNASVGRISTPDKKSVMATYTAPDKVPSKKYLEIRIKVKNRKIDFARIASIRVVDDEWGFTLELGEGHGLVSKTYSYDKALLDIDVVKKVVTISNIRNFPPKPESVTEPALSCKETLSSGAIGQINIVSATGIVDSDGLLKLRFTHSGAQFPTYIIQCPDGGVVTSGGESSLGSPTLETFQLKDGVQLHGVENDIYWAKLTAR